MTDFLYTMAETSSQHQDLLQGILEKDSREKDILEKLDTGYLSFQIRKTLRVLLEKPFQDDGSRKRFGTRLKAELSGIPSFTLCDIIVNLQSNDASMYSRWDLMFPLESLLDTYKKAGGRTKGHKEEADLLLKLWSDYNLMITLLQLRDFPDQLKSLIKEVGYSGTNERDCGSTVGGESKLALKMSDAIVPEPDNLDYTNRINRLIGINKLMDIFHQQIDSMDQDSVTESVLKPQYLLMLELNKLLLARTYSDSVCTSDNTWEQTNTSQEPPTLKSLNLTTPDRFYTDEVNASLPSADRDLPQQIELTHENPEEQLTEQESTTDWFDDLEDDVFTIKAKEEVPTELLKCLTGLCLKHKVINPTWSSSVSKAKTIHVTGGGVDEIWEPLMREVGERFPDFKIELFDDAHPIRLLSGTIQQRQYDERNEQWREGNRATCELIVSGHKHANNKRGLFAVTCAHLLADKDCKQIACSPLDQVKKIKELRDLIKSRVDSFSYNLMGSARQATLYMNLGNPALIAYRNFGSAKMKAFFTDVAIIPIEDGSEEVLKKRGLVCHSCKMTEIGKLTEKMIEKMGRMNLPGFYVRERPCQFEPGRSSLDPDYPLANRLTFRIEEGNPLEPGDSGSVIYRNLPNGNGKVALALVQSQRKDQPQLYEAVPLDEALKHLHADYPHLIGTLSLFTNNEHEEGARPPNT